MGNVNMEAYQVHYKGNESVADHLRHLDLDVEKAAVLPDLPTTEGKTVLTAVTDDQGDTELTYETPEVEQADIAPVFSEEGTYSAGELVYKDGQLYKFDSDHAAGAWDSSEVSLTTVAAEFNQLKNTLGSLTITNWIEAQSAISVPANDYANLTLEYTPPTGYQIIAVVAVSTGNVDISIEKFDGAEKTMRVHNHTSNARDAVAGFKFLLMKV